MIDGQTYRTTIQTTIQLKQPFLTESNIVRIVHCIFIQSIGKIKNAKKILKSAIHVFTSASPVWDRMTYIFGLKHFLHG